MQNIATRTGMCVLSGVLALLLTSIAAAQAPGNFRIEYDGCGARSLAWDPVSAATVTEYRVYRGGTQAFCSGISATCASGAVLLATTAPGSPTRVNDLAEPVPHYRVVALAGGAVLGFADLEGDRIVAGSLVAQSRASDVEACLGDNVRLQATVVSPPIPLTYLWRRNGAALQSGSLDFIDVVASASEQGAVYSVTVSNGCTSSTASWPQLTFGSMPAIDDIRWVSFAKAHDDYEHSDYCFKCLPCNGGCRSNPVDQTHHTQWNCNHGELDANRCTVGIAAWQSASGTGCSDWNNDPPYCYLNYRKHSEQWLANGIVTETCTMRVAGSVSAGASNVYWFTTFADMTIRNNGIEILRIRWPNSGDGGVLTFDHSLTVAPGTIEIEAKGQNIAELGFGTNQVSASLTATCTIVPLGEQDCNLNGQPDGSDIATGSSPDVDGNGRPDECQTVIVPGNYASIQDAIDTAPANEMRIISVVAGTYPGPIAFNGKWVKVRGAGAGQTIISSTGGQQVSVVRFTGGEPPIASLEQVTVRGGNTGTPLPGAPTALVGGGVFGIDSAASVRDCVVEQNASGFGGGAYFLRCTGEVRGTTFRNNDAVADGGGLQSNDGSQHLTDLVIENNTCNSRGGGMHLVRGNPALTRVTVRNNHANGLSGGLSWYGLGSDTAMATLDGCTVTGNSALVTQGGIGISAPTVGTSNILLRATNVCNNTPRPNVSGAWVDLGGNSICDCMGDLSGDGTVNGADIGLLLSSWGYCGSACPYDINHDGVINGGDLGLLLSDWGPCPN